MLAQNLEKLAGHEGAELNHGLIFYPDMLAMGSGKNQQRLVAARGQTWLGHQADDLRLLPAHHVVGRGNTGNQIHRSEPFRFAPVQLLRPHASSVEGERRLGVRQFPPAD